MGPKRQADSISSPAAEGDASMGVVKFNSKKAKKTEQNIKDKIGSRKRNNSKDKR